MSDLTLEELAEKVDKVWKIAENMEKKKHEGTDHMDEEEKMKAKKAEDEKKEKEMKEAKRAEMDDKMKEAMEEKDHDKKMAKMKKAMEDYDEHIEKVGLGKPKESQNHEAMTEEEKEHVASIVDKDKQDYINKILTAATITAPEQLEDIKKMVKTASISELKNYAKFVPDFTGVAAKQTISPQKPIIPFFASMNPAEIDSKQLNASSPDSAFASMSTKDLMEGKV